MASPGQAPHREVLWQLSSRSRKLLGKLIAIYMRFVDAGAPQRIEKGDIAFQGISA